MKKEYVSIKEILKGNFFTEEKASYSAFTGQLDKINLLHISTHSFVQGEESVPVLQLADDKFFLFELYGKYFQPELVVLSACRTGYGMLAEGEGIISLARGFTASGAEGIIAGQWNMNDETTALLAETFYRELQERNHPADALHAVKLQWLEREHAAFYTKLPYYWAGLVYYGNDNPVSVQVKNEMKWRLWIAAMFILILVIAVIYRRINRKSLVSNRPGL